MLASARAKAVSTKCWMRASAFEASSCTSSSDGCAFSAACNSAGAPSCFAFIARASSKHKLRRSTFAVLHTCVLKRW